MDLSQLTFEDFSSRIGDGFHIAADGDEKIVLVLEQAEKKSGAGGAPRPDNAYSVVFVGPLSEPLEQRIYEMEHSELGTLPLFIVPVEQDEKGIHYEAVFTRLAN